MNFDPEAAVAKMRQHGMEREGSEIRGCSAQEITRIENRFQLKLPETYKLFLKAMGKGTGEFLTDCSVTYPFIICWHDTAERLFKEQDLKFQSSAFVFLERNAEQVLFFDTADGNDDPPIFRYLEGDAEPVEVCKSFTEWFNTTCREEIETWDELREQLERSYANHEAEESVKETRRMEAMSPIKVGDTVIVCQDLKGVESLLGDESKIDIPKGSVGTALTLGWYGGDYSHIVELVDETGLHLWGLPTLYGDVLKLVRS